MRVPTVRGVIDRRILVNYRVAPAVLTELVPPPFRPKLVNEMGMAGVCLIRLQHIRPSALPPLIGLSSENAAHRIAVEWDERGERREGVYIPRRDSSSWLSTLLGGRLFPAVLHHARFRVAEGDDHFQIELDSDDGQTHLAVAGRVSEHLSAASVFRSLQEASAFFERGATGYSATPRAGEYDGLELRSFNWRVEPLAIEHVESSFFDDGRLFPRGAAQFDCALLMRRIEHEWHARASLRGEPT